MTAGDMYQRPRPEEIRARVEAADRERKAADATPAGAAGHETGSPAANFAVHLRARMRALGWDQAQLMEHAGIKTPHIAARAISGAGCDLGLAGRIATAVGGYLAAMIGPYLCRTCAGEPPEGFACLECGTEARPS